MPTDMLIINFTKEHQKRPVNQEKACIRLSAGKANSVTAILVMSQKWEN